MAEGTGSAEVGRGGGGGGIHGSVNIQNMKVSGLVLEKKRRYNNQQSRQ